MHSRIDLLLPAVAILGLVSACSDDQTCGAGTVNQGATCIAELACGEGTLAVDGLCLPIVSCGEGTQVVDDFCVPELSAQADAATLGKLLYFDTRLSSPAGQSCASCHSPFAGFTDPNHALPVSRGAHPWLVGNRNSPSAAYATFSPPFHFDDTEEIYFGGQFWDGRAADLVEQAKGPFLNPVEMGNADEAEVMSKIENSAYADLFIALYGEDIFDDVESSYHAMAEAIAAFEATDEVNPFTSKFDFVAKGEATFTAAEQRGLALFQDPEKGNCAACHPDTSDDAEVLALFTDFSYDNLGVPANLDNPFYALDAEFNPDGFDFVDRGLGGVLDLAEEDGKFKVPTLRNIAITGPYMHNGVFSTLTEVVDFYNTRDVGDFGPPEVAANVNTEELGDLGLSTEEVADIVAFMMTLTDGYVPMP